jgi:hypothetical protein
MSGFPEKRFAKRSSVLSRIIEPLFQDTTSCRARTRGILFLHHGQRPAQRGNAMPAAGVFIKDTLLNINGTSNF